MSQATALKDLGSSIGYMSDIYQSALESGDVLVLPKPILVVESLDSSSVAKGHAT